MAEKTAAEQHAERQQRREKGDTLRRTSNTVDERSYKLAPGEYAGRIGREEGTIKVDESGVYTTRKADEQAFIESSIGREPQAAPASKAKE